MVQRTKKSGVPTRDKVSKAIALIQSSPKTKASGDEPPSPSNSRRPMNLSLTIPSEPESRGGSNQKDSFLVKAFSSRAASSGKTSSTKDKQKQQGKDNNFANKLYNTIHNQKQPHYSENDPRFGDVGGHSNKPLTPRAAAAAAARNSPRNSRDGSAGPLTPRSAAAMAYASGKRKVRREQEALFSKKSIEQALMTVSSQGGVSTGSGTSGRRQHSSGRYQREWNSKSHQDDVDAALKVSTDIEKDIQATSQTLAQISQFIDTVSMPSSKSNKGNKKKKNNSFVQVYKRNMADASTVDSCAAIAEEDEEEEQRETRDPEATWSSVREASSERDSRPPPRTRGVDASEGSYGKDGRGRIYIADNEEFDSLATYTSNPASSEPSRQSPAVSVFATSVKTKDHEKETVYYTVMPKKSSGFDALLSAASASSSDKVPTSTRQVPIQVGSPVNSRPKSDAKEGANKSRTAQERRDERSAASAQSKASGKSEDPPDSDAVPQSMGSEDELQKREWGVDSNTSGSSDSLDDEFMSSIGTPNDPQILSEISAFIDRVEQKNKRGKSKKKSADSVHKSKDQLSSAYDFDAATLSSMFDEPKAPRSGLTVPSKGDKKEEGDPTAKKKTRDTKKTKGSVVSPSPSDRTFPSLFSIQTGNDLSWQEMERMLNSITKQQDAPSDEDINATAKDVASAQQKSGAEPSSVSAARSKEDDPICLVRGDLMTENQNIRATKSKTSRDPEANAKRRLQIDPTAETVKPFLTNVSTPTNKPRTAFNRGADPPPKGEDEQEVCPKKDPPAEDASISGDRSHSPKEPSPTHKAQAHGKHLTPRHRGGPPRPEGPTLASKGVKVTGVEDANEVYVSSAEVEVIHVEGTENTLASKEIEVIHLEEEAAAETSPDKQKALRVNPTGPGSETTPIMVVSPSATEFAETPATLFVDLTSVCSGDMYEDETKEKAAAEGESHTVSGAGKKMHPPNKNDLQIEKDHVKAWLNADLDCMSQDQALKELLEMAEDSPRKMPSHGGVLDIGFSADSDDEANATDDDDLAYDGESDTSKSTYPRQKSELPPTPKVSHRTVKEEGSSHSSRNPPGEYAGSSQRDEELNDQDESERERDELLKTVIGSQPGDIVSEGEDDRDPLQSLLFAQKNNALEMAAERKNAGMSLVQLTLDEVKNFVGSNLFETGEISNQRIKELQQLDERVPSLLSDLGDGGVSDNDTTSESVKPDVASEANHVSPTGESHQAANEDQSMPVTYDFQPASGQVASQAETKSEVLDATRPVKASHAQLSGPSPKSKPVTYDFQSASKQSASQSEAKSEVVDASSQSKPAQLSGPSSESKKGIKRKLLANTESPSTATVTVKATPTNWLASLDSIFSCKRPDSSKSGGASTLQTGGTTQNDKHAVSSSPSDEATDDNTKERVLEGAPKSSEQVEAVNTRFSFSSDRPDRSASREQEEGVSGDETSEAIVVPDDDSWDAIKEEDDHPSPKREEQGGDVEEEIIIPDDDSWDAKKGDSSPRSPREGQENKIAEADAENKEIVVSDDEDDIVGLSALPSGPPPPPIENVSKPEAGDNFDSNNVKQKQFTIDGLRSEGVVSSPAVSPRSEMSESNQDETIRSGDLEGLPILVNSSEEASSEGVEAALGSHGHLPNTTNERQKGETDDALEKNSGEVAHERNSPPDSSQAHLSDNEIDSAEPASSSKETPPDRARKEIANERNTTPDSSEAHSSDNEIDNAEPAPSEETPSPYEDHEDKPRVPDLLKFASQAESLDEELQGQKRGGSEHEEPATGKVLPPRDTQLPSSLSQSNDEVAKNASTDDGRDGSDRKPDQTENQESLFVDLTHQEDESGDFIENGAANAWEVLLDLGSLQQQESEERSWGKPAESRSWEKPTDMQKGSNQAPHESDLEAMTTAQEKVTTSSTPRDDTTPRMHQNKRFDFIEDVDEDENIDAYFSRMTSLKKGGHLPNYNIKPLGSYAEKGHEEDADNVEVDFDVGFVKKSLAPEPNLNTWDEDDDLVKHDNRYVSIEESTDDEDDKHELTLKARLDARLETISDGDEDETSVGSSTRGTSFEPSSTRGSTFDDRATDEESVGSVRNPIVVDSTSLNEMDDQFPVDDDGGIRGIEDGDNVIEAYESLSYESDNDEWLRKRDLATRKTQNPNSWITRTTSGIQSKLSFVSVETAKPINGVAAAKKILSRSVKRRGGRRRNPIPPTNVWKLSYKERTREHTGYFDVDVFSLVDSSAVGVQQPHHLDAAPWESRDVRQRFLQESSIGFSKNWFGKAQRSRGNDRVKERVAHPKSMEMPMEAKPHTEDWTEEWYKPWEKPPNRSESRSVTSSYTGTGSGTGSGTVSDEPSDTETCTAPDRISSSSSYNDSGSYSTSANFTSDAETDMDDRSYYYEDTPQCGELINVKPKIGERVSRIHPDYTSQLRRSRWRKKYFPRGTFPYK